MSRGNITLIAVYTSQDPAAAKALVSAGELDGTKDQSSDSENHPDVLRAKELITLHNAIRQAHSNGEVDKALSEARAAVRQLHYK